MTKLYKDTFCSYCGTEFQSNHSGHKLGFRTYPLSCHNCGNETYLPAPAVGIGLVPINNGLLIVRRNIPPNVGGIALPGGFKDVGETWQEGIAREVFEETGITVDPNGIRLADAHTAHNGAVLLFGLCERLILDTPVQFNLDGNGANETQEAFIMEVYEELCFPHHATMAKKWFDGEFNGKFELDLWDGNGSY